VRKCQNILNGQDILINGQKVDQVKNTKFLGVVIDEKLNWAQHIEFVKSKISKGIGIICKARKALNSDTLKTLYYSFVYPYLVYCIENWGLASKIYIDSLFKLQKRLIRIIAGVNYLAHTASLFSQKEIMPLFKIYIYTVLVFMFKVYNNMFPSSITRMFTMNMESHNYNTRHSNFYRLPLMRLATSQRFIRFMGPKLWNYYCTICNFTRVYTFPSFKKKC